MSKLLLARWTNHKQNRDAKYLLLFSIIFSLVVIPAIGLGTTYNNQDLPSNLQSYIDHIEFDATDSSGQGARIYFNNVQPISGTSAEYIASFIVNSPSWKGSRSTSSVANEILGHWFLAVLGIDRSGATRSNAVSPIHLEYNSADQSIQQQFYFNSAGPVTGFATDIIGSIDNKIPIEQQIIQGDPYENAMSTVPAILYSVPPNYHYPDQPADPQPTAAADALSVGNPQSNVVWQETSPTGSSGSNILGTTQTTSQSTDAKFSFGDRVEVTTSLGLHVRSVPGDLTNDPAIPLEPKGSLGTIQEGSRVYKNGFYWVEIKYDDGKTGWSAEDWLESVQSNQQPVTQSTETALGDNQLSVTQPVDPQPVTQSTETAFGDNQLSVTQPVDPQPVTSPYASQIPVGDTQTTHYFSSVDQPPGKVTVGLDIRDENGNIVPVGTTVMVKDGSGEYVQVDWDSTGHALAYGAPGNWIVTVDAPGYETNTQYTPVSSSSSSTSFKMNLQRAGFNDQPAPISSPSVTQPVDQTVSSVAKVPLELDIRNENGNIVPTGTVVTVKDGNNNVVQVNWDSTGHALAYGAPGNWIVTVDAPGYETNTQYTPVSSSSSSTSFRMNLLKDGINIQPPVSSPPVDQQPVTQPVNQQTYPQPINQQPATQPSEPTLGENEHGPTFGEVDQQPVESQPYSQPIGYGNVSPG